jgi:peptide-N4-(N-acetyl-beta-glucosaminyl)asparagine amidase
MLAYCIGFSIDGAMDVTRRYVRNFSKWGERNRASEPTLLHILDEIRAMNRKDLSKSEKFRLAGEDSKEYQELQGYVASAVADELCKAITLTSSKSTGINR